MVHNDAVVAIRGRLSYKNEAEPEILIESITEVDKIAELIATRNRQRNYLPRNSAPKPEQRGNTQNPDNYVKLRVTPAVEAEHGDGRGLLYHITDILSLYPGDREVLVYLPSGKMVRADAKHSVNLTDELRSKLIALLGEGNVKG